MVLSDRDSDFDSCSVDLPPSEYGRLNQRDYYLPKTHHAFWYRSLEALGVTKFRALVSLCVSANSLFLPDLLSLPLSLTCLAFADIVEFGDQSVTHKALEWISYWLSPFDPARATFYLLDRSFKLVTAALGVASFTQSWLPAQSRLPGPVASFVALLGCPFRWGAKEFMGLVRRVLSLIAGWILPSWIPIEVFEGHNILIDLRDAFIDKCYSDVCFLPWTTGVFAFAEWLAPFSPEEHTVTSYLTSAKRLWGAVRAIISPHLDDIFQKAPGERMDGYQLGDPSLAWTWHLKNPPPTPAEGTVRVRWYREICAVTRGTYIGYTSTLLRDFPLDPEGNLNLGKVREEWGMYNCKVLDCGRYGGLLHIFEPSQCDMLTPLAIKVLTDEQECLRVIEEPPPNLQTIRECRKVVRELWATYASTLPKREVQVVWYTRLALFLFFSSLYLVLWHTRGYVYPSHLHSYLSIVLSPCATIIFFLFHLFCTLIQSFSLAIVQVPFTILRSYHTYFPIISEFYLQHYAPLYGFLFVVWASLIMATSDGTSMIAHHV